MTTENTFAGTAETLKENVAKSIKWMQDTNAKMFETQKQQMQTVSEMFGKTFSTNPLNGNNAMNNAFGANGKAALDLFKKNMETATNIMKTTMQPVMDLPKFNDKDSFLKEMNKQIETLNQQLADLTIANQNNLNIILDQATATNKAFTPIADQFRAELEKTSELTKENIQKITESYSAFTAPNMEANRVTMENVTEQVKSAVKENVKFWTNLLSTVTAKATEATAEAAETVKPETVIKITAGNKKQAAASMN